MPKIWSSGMMAANIASMQVLEKAGMPTIRRIVKPRELGPHCRPGPVL